ncbi:MAG: hypothetical protein IKN33_01795 [Selenomonadaceae bacterium]|nr:hypothetical protein [Selenomonadaceae bacterium]
MPSVRIKLIGEVAFPNSMEHSEGYRCNVPTDQFGIPYLPMQDIIGDDAWPALNAQIGFAHPDGYLGLLRAGQSLYDAVPRSAVHVRSYFTNDRFVREEAYRTRSLKAGQVFFASIRFAPEKREAVIAFLQSIRHLGIAEKGITGEVECSLWTDEEEGTEQPAFSHLCEYHALDYSLTLLTPACFYAPCSEDPQTYVYAPGSIIRRALVRQALGEDAEDIICTNAYISRGLQRLLPVPICMSVVKLDKEQLRYRLASDKDFQRSEQEVNLPGAYCEGFESHLIRYAVAETERIVSGAGEVHDALIPGQILCGTIYGPDAAMRRIASYIADHPRMNIGTLSAEGFGEVLIRTDRLRERDPKAEILAKRFDVVCLSDVMIINDEGMPGCSAEDLLGEVERLLGVSGRLCMEGKYTEVQKDFSVNLDWGCDGMIARCLKAGSVIRLRTTDGEPVDIAPILHGFVGERNPDGYGEIMAYPARDQYYRVAECIEFLAASTPSGMDNKMFRLNLMKMLVSIRAGHLGARMTHAVLDSVLRQRVEFLAMIDREDYKNGVSVSDLIPTEVLDMLKNLYDPELPDETLVEWYVAGLEEERDAWNFD